MSAPPRPLDLSVVAFITAVTLAVLAFVWLGRRQQTGAVDIPSIVPAFFTALTAAALFADPEIGQANALFYGAAFIVALVAVALYRAPAIALLHAAGAAAAMVFVRNAFSGSFGFDLFGEPITLEGFPLLPSGRRHGARRHRDRRGFCCRRIVERAPSRRGAGHRRRRLGGMGRRRAAGHPVLASGWPSAISSAISFMPRSPSRLPRCSRSPAR